MARIKFTAIVEDIRGSIGGTTFQKNAYGYSAKRRPNMVKPNSPNQLASQIRFSQAVRAWDALTNEQRANWETYASTYPQYSKHNLDSQLSGYALFVKYNSLYLYQNVGIRATVALTNPVVHNPTYTLVVSGGVLTIAATWDIEEEEFINIISLSRPMGNGQNFVGSRTRFVKAVTSLDGSFNITTQYLALFGALPIVGDRIAIDSQLIGESNGKVPSRLSTIVTVTAS